jgi:hypothetical protein
MIRAEVQTDDDRLSALFDATPFFERATFAQLAALRDSDWGGDGPADAVALFMLERDDAVTDLFRYLALDPVTDDDFPVGFECYVSETDVARWVKRNRPGWCERLWPKRERPDATALNRTSLDWLALLFRPSGAGCALSLR